MFDTTNQIGMIVPKIWKNTKIFQSPPTSNSSQSWTTAWIRPNMPWKSSDAAHVRLCGSKPFPSSNIMQHLYIHTYIYILDGGCNSPNKKSQPVSPSYASLPHRKTSRLKIS